MKRLILLLSVFASFLSCEQNSKIQVQKLVEDYMNEHYSPLAPFVVTEVSEIDSLYSPFMELASLSLQYSELDLAAVKAWNQLDKCSSKKEFNKMKEELLDGLQTKYDELSSVCAKLMFGLDHPELKPEKNRTGVKATYQAGGQVNDGYFFFNTDGKSIGHTSMENYTTFKAILSTQSKCRSDISEVRYMEW